LNLAEWIFLALTTLLGFGMARTGLCVIACTQDWVHKRDAAGLWLHVLTVSALAVIALVTISIWHTPIPQSSASLGHLLLGAVGVLVGFVINGGCYFGSVSYLTQGNLNYVGTLIGITLAERYPLPATQAFKAAEALTTQALPSVSPHWGQCLWVVVWVGLVGVAWVKLRSQCAQRPKLIRRVSGVLILILAASLLNVVQPGWNYSITLTHLAFQPFGGWDVTAMAGLMVLLGAIVANLLARHWQLIPITVPRLLRCCVGGMVMDQAAQWIPGGSDAWILWGVPRLAVHGLIAYGVVMALLLIPSIWIKPKS
jgi:uncharacterized protein